MRIRRLAYFGLEVNNSEYTNLIYNSYVFIEKIVQIFIIMLIKGQPAPQIVVFSVLHLIVRIFNYLAFPYVDDLETLFEPICKQICAFESAFYLGIIIKSFSACSRVYPKTI